MRRAHLTVYMIVFGAQLGTFVSCSSKANDTGSPIEPTLFAQLYTEIVVLSIDSCAVDSLDALEWVLNRHGITKAAFEDSRAYFKEHPEIWLAVLTEVEDRLKKLKEERAATALPDSTTPTMPE